MIKYYKIKTESKLLWASYNEMDCVQRRSQINVVFAYVKDVKFHVLVLIFKIVISIYNISHSLLSMSTSSKHISGKYLSMFCVKY
jgi:hypothetical protein